MTTRAVLYARVSGNDRNKEGRNLAGQLEMAREYALKRGYQIVTELAEDDRGASGAEINLPQLTRVRDMATADEFDVLVTREIDRLSRKLAKQLIIEQELKQKAVRIEYVLGEYPDTPEGNLQKHVKAAVAEYEREKVTERLTRGRRQKVKTGHIVAHGRPPYGYRLADVDGEELIIHELDGTQRHVKRDKDDGLENGKRVLFVHEQEKRVVQLIFQWYTVGDEKNPPLSLYGIAKRLTESRIPTPADRDSRIAKKRGYGQWNRATLNKILRRETYTGTWHYGKVRSDSTKNVYNERDHWIPIKVPAIISREMWEGAQKRMEKNKRDSPRNTKYNYLLRRRLKCGDCGTKMQAQKTSESKGGYSYYYCPARSKKYATECNQRKYFRVDQVDAAVWEWLRELILNPEATLRELRKEQANREKANKPLYDRLAVADDLLTDNRVQLERVLDLYLAGDFPREILLERKTRLEATIDALERERADLAAQLEAAILTDEQIETVAKLAAKMRKGLKAAEADFDKQCQLIGVQILLITRTDVLQKTV